MSQNLNDFNCNGNEFMSILREATSLHRSARQKHLQLLELCKSRGVAFSDLRNYMMNQAKKSGLYRKTVFVPNDDPTKCMTYPTLKSLKNLSWYTAINNFILWSNRNYVDYGQAKRKVVKANTSEKTVVVVKRDPAVFGNRKSRRDTSTPQMADVPKSAEEILEDNSQENSTPDSTPKDSGSTGNQKPAPPASSNKTSRQGSTLLTKPVEKDLSLAEKQALLLRSRGILADMAIEKGASEEWNIFCEAMDWTDKMVETPDAESQLKAAFA